MKQQFTDKEKQVAKYFRMTRSYTRTAELMDPPMTRQNVERYVLVLRALGVDLPKVNKRGPQPRKKVSDDRNTTED